MNKEVLDYLYQNPIYLDYLRHNPKWYPVIESDPSNLSQFIKEAKSKLKLTTYDKIEDAKKKIGFLSSMINYFTEKN